MEEVRIPDGVLDFEPGGSNVNGLPLATETQPCANAGMLLPPPASDPDSEAGDDRDSTNGAVSGKHCCYRYCSCFCLAVVTSAVGDCCVFDFVW